MWLALLIAHGLLAFLLLGAITHQVVSAWAPAHARRGNILVRFSAVPGAGYVTAVIVLYIVNASFGGLIYTLYRISARLTLEQGHYWKTFGAFELKEHLVAVGLGLLPAYWYFWRSPGAEDHPRTRLMLTTLLAFIVWWGFIVGHLANNIRGLAT
ncbi:MAG: hypothetical protein JO000_00585 [Alphaproteobacteria bacterium]|nr:hypothetical protein [Alphaproteobacteria bacterium]